MNTSGRGCCRMATGTAVVLWMAATVAAQGGSSGGLPPMSPSDVSEGLREGVSQAAMRLPLAAGLGALLALRPRRAGSPPHDWAVIQTQIVLAIVGALILIIVGASLARAFGIAGAANLIRYRAKIEDPKDAVVMLSTLSVGLACGVLAIVITRGLFFIEDLYRRLPVGEFWHPVIGAVGFATVGIFVPRALGVGYDAISDVLNARLAVGTVAALAVGKLIAWWLALGSRTSGGTLAPVLLISASFGTVVGAALSPDRPLRWQGHIVPGGPRERIRSGA